MKLTKIENKNIISVYSVFKQYLVVSVSGIGTCLDGTSLRLHIIKLYRAIHVYSVFYQYFNQILIFLQFKRENQNFNTVSLELMSCACSRCNYTNTDCPSKVAIAVWESHLFYLEFRKFLGGQREHVRRNALYAQRTAPTRDGVQTRRATWMRFSRAQN